MKKIKVEVQTYERMVLRFTVDAKDKTEAREKATNKAKVDGYIPLYVIVEKY